MRKTNKMLTVKITEAGQKKIDNLKFDIEESLNRIIEFVPKMDLIGLKYIYVTDEPGEWKKHLANASGAYFQKTKNAPAYIEMYLSRLFGHINSAESSMLMVPFQNIGLAQTLFHEVGHHVEKTRSHGISKKKRETFAKKYEQTHLSKYLSANVDSINSCFQDLEKIAEEKGLSQEILKKMKDGWETQYNNLCN